MDCYEKETDCTASLHDPVHVVLWIVVGAVALAGIVGIVLYLMKRKK